VGVEQSDDLPKGGVSAGSRSGSGVLRAAPQAVAA
jgi:hypothetical protein